MEISYLKRGDFAYANEFPNLAGGGDVVILRT